MPVRSCYVDIDGTVANDTLTLFPGVKEKLEQWFERSYFLIAWSHGGAEHAKKVCVKNGIDKYFKHFLDKPDIIVDDNPDMIMTFPAVLRVDNPEEWWTKPDRDLFRASRKRHGGQGE